MLTSTMIGIRKEWNKLLSVSRGRRRGLHRRGPERRDGGSKRVKERGGRRERPLLSRVDVLN